MRLISQLIGKFNSLVQVQIRRQCIVILAVRVPKLKLSWLEEKLRTVLFFISPRSLVLLFLLSIRCPLLNSSPNLRIIIWLCSWRCFCHHCTHAFATFPLCVPFFRLAFTVGLPVRVSVSLFFLLPYLCVSRCLCFCLSRSYFQPLSTCRCCVCTPLPSHWPYIIYARVIVPPHL